MLSWREEEFLDSQVDQDTYERESAFADAVWAAIEDALTRLLNQDDMDGLDHDTHEETQVEA